MFPTRSPFRSGTRRPTPSRPFGPGDAGGSGSGSGSGDGGSGDGGKGGSGPGSGDGGSGDGGDDHDDDPKMDLDAWRRQARKNERDLKAVRTELDKIKNANQSELERQLEKAREEGRAEIRAEVANVRVEAAVMAAAAESLANPADAVTFLRDDFADLAQGDGRVDDKAVKAAIARLLRERPYLARQGSRSAPLPGGGARQTSGQSMNDDIRRRIRG